MYVTHIVANRAWWFHARMGEGGDDLTPLELWAIGAAEADVDPGHTAAELVAGLEKTWRMIEATLARLRPCAFARLDHLGCHRTRHPSRPRDLHDARRARPAGRRHGSSGRVA